MNERALLALLEGVKNGTTSADEALARLRTLPVQELEGALLDHHRSLRTGLPEAVFAEFKSAKQLVDIRRAMLDRDHVVLAA